MDIPILSGAVALALLDISGWLLPFAEAPHLSTTPVPPGGIDKVRVAGTRKRSAAEGAGPLQVRSIRPPPEVVNNEVTEGTTGVAAANMWWHTGMMVGFSINTFQLSTFSAESVVFRTMSSPGTFIILVVGAPI